jgi:hypothetical protein
MPCASLTPARPGVRLLPRREFTASKYAKWGLPTYGRQPPDELLRATDVRDSEPVAKMSSWEIETAIS